MQKETLKLIDDVLTALSIPYEFDEFTSDISSLDYFFTGTYQETEPTSEGGEEEATFILTGVSRGGVLVLENAKQQIKTAFPTTGKMAILDNGAGVAISYGDSAYIPSGDEFLKKIQINISVKEWMVN